jgi:NAD(P)-dependent dehydrogenase (short-subunit alcohol dehydrogenase family)
VDTLVNNAGVFVAKPFTDYTDAEFDLVTGVNLRGFFGVTRRAIAAMLRNNGTRRGHVVNIFTSLVDHANTAVPSALASLTKGGLNAATRSLAIEYAARGVRVNTVSPGIIRTPMHAEETHDTLAALHPVGGWATSATLSTRSRIWRPPNS